MYQVKVKSFKSDIIIEFEFQNQSKDMNSNKKYIKYSKSSNKFILSNSKSQIFTNKCTDDNIIINNTFHLFLGMIKFFDRSFFLFAQKVTKVSILEIGEIYKIDKFYLMDTNTVRELNEVFQMLEEFFESLAGKVFYYIPYNLHHMVISL